MAKNKGGAAHRAAGGTSTSAGTSPEKAKAKRSEGTRETVESIAIALILALMFRTFQAEGFEIPTGSMGPTLMGAHKDLDCPHCGYQFQSGASIEFDNETGRRMLGREVTQVSCPLCRWPVDIERAASQGESYPTYSGDRIQVSKYSYWFDDPSRWDVAVFKYPHETHRNYIKRIVGLPGETLKIHHGNIYVRDGAEGDFEIARKPPSKVLALLQPISDTDYTQLDTIQRGWPAPWTPREDDGAWDISEDFRSFRVTAPQGQTSWLAYQHVVPGLSDWEQMGRGKLPENWPRLPQLVTDFYGYNTAMIRNATMDMYLHSLGMHWVSDLAVESRAQVESAEGELQLELVAGGVTFRCTIDVASGEARLAISDLPEFSPTAQTVVRGPGSYELRFANVDDQLLLWVNGSVVSFNTETTYAGLDNSLPTAEDLAPVRIGATGATITFSQLRVLRDVYYIATRPEDFHGVSGLTDYPADSVLGNPRLDLARYLEVMTNPAEFGAFDTRREVEFAMGEDEYFMLGDNSPGSQDSRLWGGLSDDFFAEYDLPRREQWVVERDLLIGKALFVYWPHPWETPISFRIPGTSIEFPFYPNFPAFRRIH